MESRNAFIGLRKFHPRPFISAAAASRWQLPRSPPATVLDRYSPSATFPFASPFFTDDLQNNKNDADDDDDTDDLGGFPSSAGGASRGRSAGGGTGGARPHAAERDRWNEGSPRKCDIGATDPMAEASPAASRERSEEVVEEEVASKVMAAEEEEAEEEGSQIRQGRGRAQWGQRRERRSRRQAAQTAWRGWEGWRRHQP